MRVLSKENDISGETGFCADIIITNCIIRPNKNWKLTWSGAGI